MTDRDYISTRAAEELRAELTAAQARVAVLEASNERLRTQLLGLFCIRIPEKDGDGFTIDISNAQADRIEEAIKTP